MAKKKQTRITSVTKLVNKQTNKLAKCGKLYHQKQKRKEHSKMKKISRQTKAATGLLNGHDVRGELGSNHGFYKIADGKALNNKGKHKLEVEEIFTSKRRERQWVAEEGIPLLPIKDKSKVIQRSEAVQPQPQKLPSEVDSKCAAIEDRLERVPPDVSVINLYAQRTKKLAERRTFIASLACTIVEDPQANVRKLRQLRELWEDDDADIRSTNRKWLMCSLTEIFTDILPDYKIRITTQQEKQQAASSDTKQLRNFEENLLKNYKMFLQILESCIKPTEDSGYYSQSDIAQMFRLLAIRCMCRVFRSHPNFNFSSNIIAVLVPLMAVRNKRILDSVCKTFQEVFCEDKTGDVSLEVVRAICRIVKQNHFRVRPLVIETFLSLKIKEVRAVATVGPKKLTYKEKMKLLSRKDRKRDKQRKELEEQLEDAAVEVNRTRILQVRTDTISAIFTLYFMILKKGQVCKLLPAVLAGLARFAHLINVDFFENLFAVFDQLLKSNKLQFSDELHIVQTVFTILSGHGQVLSIDHSRFYTTIYQRLPSIITGEGLSLIPQLLHLLKAMFLDRKKKVSNLQVLAFIKRMTTLCLLLPSDSAAGILTLVRQMFLAFPGSHLLFDNEPFGCGVYNPDIEVPEHCDARNTSLYEVHLLRKHCHPTVVILAKHLSQGAPLTGVGQLKGSEIKKSPDDIISMVNSYLDTFISQERKSGTKKKINLQKQDRFQQEYMQSLYSNLGVN